MSYKKLTDAHYLSCVSGRIYRRDKFFEHFVSDLWVLKNLQFDDLCAEQIGDSLKFVLALM